MKNKTTLVFSALIILLSLASKDTLAVDATGIIKIKSAHSVEKTILLLETALLQKGMTIFKRINHTAGAEKVGMQLRPTQLLIFGNPKAGTPLMLCAQSAALDLPQKALAYEDEAGQVWLSYNDPAYMAKRHNIKDCEEPLKKVSKALANFAKVATQ